MVSRISILATWAGLALATAGCSGPRLEPYLIEPDSEGVDPRYVSAFDFIAGYDSLAVALTGSPQLSGSVPLSVHPRLSQFSSFVSGEDNLASPCLNPEGWSARAVRDSLHRYSPDADPPGPESVGDPWRLSTARAEHGYSSRRAFAIPFVPVVQFSEPYRNLLVADVYNNLSVSADLSFAMGSSLHFTFCFDDAGAIEEFWVVEVANQ